MPWPFPLFKVNLRIKLYTTNKKRKTLYQVSLCNHRIAKTNNMFYVYIYLDPRKPGNYAYSNLNYSFLYEPYYVGKGIRGRYKNHLQNCFLDHTNVFKIRKINKLLKLYTKEYLESFIVILEYNIDEIVIYNFEEVIIKSIKRNKDKGPLTNIKSGGYGGTSGSVFDNKYIYDLKENNAILVKDAIRFNNGHKLINVSGLWSSQNNKILYNRYCKIEDHEEILEEKIPNPRRKITIYSNRFKKPISVYRYTIVKLLGFNSNKLLRGEIYQINGYFIDKEKFEYYNEKMILYRNKEEYHFYRYELSKLKEKFGIYVGHLDGEATAKRQQNFNGFFLDKEENKKFYQKHIFINNTTNEQIVMTYSDSVTFCKNNGFKYTFNDIIKKRQKNINGYSYGGELEDNTSEVIIYK